MSEPMFPKELLYSTQGHLRTRSMFIEMAAPGQEPFLSLSRQKDNGMISLRDLYVRFCTDDPSEAVFAETVFGDIEFWENLKQCNWMQPHLEKWRLISDTRRKAKAFEYIMNEIESQGKNAYGAAKFVIEEPWKDKRNAKTKAESQKSTDEAYNNVKSDIDRLREAGLIQ